MAASSRGVGTYIHSTIMRDFHSSHRKLIIVIATLLSLSLYLAGCAFDKLRLDIEGGSFEPLSSPVEASVIDAIL